MKPAILAIIAALGGAGSSTIIMEYVRPICEVLING